MNCATCRKDTSQLPFVLFFGNSHPFLWRDAGEAASFTLSSILDHGLDGDWSALSWVSPELQEDFSRSCF